MIRNLLAIGLLFPFFAHAEVEKYKIDKAHTAVVFRINHLGFSHVYGQFPDVEGDFTVDDAKPEGSSVDLKIKADSVDTHDAKRDKHLKSPDFFNTKQFPLITFKSTSVKKTGNKYDVAGNLTIHGVTKPATLTLTRNRTGKDPWNATRTGFDGNLTIKRSEFGMNFMQGENAVADDVELFLSAEGIKQ